MERCVPWECGPERIDMPLVLLRCCCEKRSKDEQQRFT